jgi:hypothetical protein
MKGKAQKREEIDPRYKWKLEDIYRQEEDWEQDFEQLKLQTQEIESCKDSLGESAAACSILFVCWKLLSAGWRTSLYMPKCVRMKITPIPIIKPYLIEPRD